MGRHNMPDRHARDGSQPSPRARRRTVAIATVLVLGVATGTAVAVRSGLLAFDSACDKDAVRVDVVASPDMAPALRSTAEYARDEDVTSDGHCLDVRVTAREAFKVADTLRSGGGESEYEAWVPDSGLWVKRAGLGGGDVPVTPVGNIASSPVTMGMIPSAAKSLGWPDKKYSWAELTAAATSEDKLRLGAADPARSASGLLALTSIAASAERAGGKAADTQVAATAKILAQRTSDSDAQALETLARDDSGTEQGNPRRNQALVVSEQAAFTHNAEAGEEGSLALFYPKDGAPHLDYPFALVDETKQSTDESRAALRFMTLLGEDAGQEILRKHGFRTRNSEPSDRLISAAGGREPQPFASASADAPSAKALDETLGMWTITVQSARLSVVVDVSASMAQTVPGRGQSRLQVTKSSLIAALGQFTDEDEVGLWRFSTKLDGDRDYREMAPTKRLGDRVGGGSHRERLTNEFGELEPVVGGATGLYDTTLAAYKQAQASYVKGKFNSLVILTDGANDDPGSISRSALVAQLKQLSDPNRPVPIIAIAVGPGTDKDEVKQIAAATGGSGQQIDDPTQIQAVILKAIMAAGQS
ncbi:substrate-binding and VWA domain-containing protein [Streptomyces sp. T-3]|nr:substrate-binding and VWA domain-containing protein [Streptomyces sp. T-3]